MIAVYVFILGLMFGSFFNVVGMRLSNNESTIGELLQIQYFKDCPEDFKKNFMLVNEFMDFLKSLK